VHEASRDHKESLERRVMLVNREGLGLTAPQVLQERRENKEMLALLRKLAQMEL